MAKSILNEDLVQKIFGKGEPVKEENVFFLEECTLLNPKTRELYKVIYDWCEFEPRSQIDFEMLKRHCKEERIKIYDVEIKTGLRELVGAGYLVRECFEMLNGKTELFYSLCGNDESRYSYWQRRKAKKTEQLRALNPQVIKILREATHNPDLLESIKERASIRWSDGLSDSLYEAVLCNIEPIEEKPERDAGGKIILRPCTDWDMELKKFQ